MISFWVSLLTALTAVSSGVVSDGRNTIKWDCDKNVTINNEISYRNCTPEVVGTTLYLNNELGRRFAAIDQDGRISLITKKPKSQ